MGKESEKQFFDRTRESLSRLGARLFRNNVGLAFFRDKKGAEHPVKYGLCNGSSDLVGWTKIQISAEMVGRHVAVFTALEGKRGRDQLSEDQSRFLSAVRNAGGIAITFPTPEAAEKFLVEEIDWLERGLKL